MPATEAVFQSIEAAEETSFCLQNRLYEPLPSGRYIRLLLIEPGELDDAIACKLNTIALDEAHFEAISYTWGTPSMTERIFCSDKSIYITANLRDALVQARRKLEPRALWADSICINQEDKEEKGLQVALMAEIYKTSSCTVICLGQRDAGAHALPEVGLIADVNAMMDRVLCDKSFSWEPDSFPVADPSEPLLSDSRWESVASLIGQPWFRRVWVVQETVLGPDARILWGNVENDWVQLLRAYCWVESRAFAVARRAFGAVDARFISRLHLMTFDLRRQEEAITVWDPGHHASLTTLQILEGARPLSVTDERDRIYACVGLPNSTPKPPELTPTYHGTHLEVYREFAFKYLRSIDMDLDILLFSQHDEEFLGDVEFGFWIPRWDLDYTTSVFRNDAQPVALVSSHAMSDARKPSLVGRNTLKVQGGRIGTVRFVSEPFTYNTTNIETVRHVWQDATSTAAGINQELTYSPRASTLEALVQTLTAGVYDGPLQACAQKQSAYLGVLRAGAGARGDTPADVTQVHEVLRTFTHHRKFIVTDRLYYGLAPFGTRVDDPVYAITGAKMVYILRETEQEDHYRFVGDSYIVSKAKTEDDQRLGPFRCKEKFNDWATWDLEEEDICLC